MDGRQGQVGATRQPVQVEQSLELAVPVRRAYDQWVKFDAYPLFMEGVRQVEQVDERRLHWVTEVAGEVREWDAEIQRREPNRAIAWRSISGPTNNGTVYFESLATERCRVTCTWEVDANGWTSGRDENRAAGAVQNEQDAKGILSLRLRRDLQRLKGLLEDRRVRAGTPPRKI